MKISPRKRAFFYNFFGFFGKQPHPISPLREECDFTRSSSVRRRNEEEVVCVITSRPCQRQAGLAFISLIFYESVNLYNFLAFLQVIVII